MKNLLIISLFCLFAFDANAQGYRGVVQRGGAGGTGSITVGDGTTTVTGVNTITISNGLQVSGTTATATVGILSPLSQIYGGSGTSVSYPLDIITDQRSQPLNVVAHRGYMSFSPQNTMRAFNRAIKDGAKLLETDVQMSSDGIPVLFHDATMDVITDCTGTLVSKDLATLQACTMDNAITVGYPSADLHIPTFDDLVKLAVATRTMLIPEIKGYRTQADIAIMVGVVTSNNAEGLVIWQCDTYSDCTYVRSVAPNSTIAYFGRGASVSAIETEIDAIAAYKNSIYFNELTNFESYPEVISYAYSKDVTLFVYDINTVTDIQTAATLGIRNIFSNIPYNPAGQANNGPTHNTFDGELALMSYVPLGTNVIYNTAYGYHALANPAYDGEKAVAIGAYALGNAGSGNTTSVAIGYEAGYSATSAGQTLIGYLAGKYVQGGNKNTALGALALVGNSTTPIGGVNNTAIGYNSISAAQGAANFNTAIGTDSCSSVTTGDSNICVGPGAGKTILTTGSYNILIGNGITTPAASTSGWLALGTTIVGDQDGGSLSTCGTSPALSSQSNDIKGTITTGSAATACTYTFATARSAAPTCIVTARSGTQPVYDTTTSTLILSTAAASAVYDYFCTGY